MATTKIWPVRNGLKRLVDYAGNPEKTEYEDLRQTLAYAGRAEKVSGESSCFVTGVNCTPERAFEEMTQVKRRFGKTGGNLAYHAYQSFKPGEVTPEQCHEIGVKLARELWGDKFQVLVATHLDREHLHNHFVINSVSHVNGKKFNDDKRCYRAIREASDRLCREYALSVIEKPGGHTPRSLYFAEKRGEPTKYNLMRQAIDEAIAASLTYQLCKEALLRLGYVLDDNPAHRYATIRRISDKKAVRLYRLGEDYDLPAIKTRVWDRDSLNPAQVHAVFHPPVPKVAHGRMKGSFRKAPKIKGFRALCLHYCYLLGIIPKKGPRRKPLSPEAREALRRLEGIERMTRLVIREKLDTPEDVERFIQSQQEELASMTTERQQCYNRLRRCDDPEEIAQIKARRDRLTSSIKQCRLDLKTAQSISETAALVKRHIAAEEELKSIRKISVISRMEKDNRREHIR